MPLLTYNDGFTFLQLLITLSIILILIIIGIPGFNSLLENNKLKMAAEQFYSNMQFVRSETIKNKTNIYVDLRPGTTWCYGINNLSACNCNSSGNCMLNGIEKVITSTEFSPVSMSTSNISNNTLRFKGGMGTTNDNSTISFSLNKKVINIEINPIGRVRICSNTVSGYKSC